MAALFYLTSEVSTGFTARPTLVSLLTQNYNVETLREFRSDGTRTSRYSQPSSKHFFN